MTDQTTPTAVDGHTITRHQQDGSHWWTCTCGAGREWALEHRWAVDAEADDHLKGAAYLAALPSKELRELLDDYGPKPQPPMVTFPGIIHDDRPRVAALRAEIDRRIAALTGARP